MKTIVVIRKQDIMFQCGGQCACEKGNDQEKNKEKTLNKDISTINKSEIK